MPNMVYKIKRLSDGLFSTGGACPGFNAQGKIWSSYSTLRQHLALVLDYGYRNNYKECEIIGYEQVEELISDVHQEFASIEEKRRTKEEKLDIINKRIRIEQLKRELEELQKS